jgi:hypothetical protein
MRIRHGNHKHHAPEQTTGAEPGPRSRQNAVYHRRTISKNEEDFGGGHVGGGDFDWRLGG